MPVSVEVVSVWFNEEFLAPFFLRHYNFADKISIYYDSDSTDRTLDIIRADSKVDVKPFRFPDMMDSALKQGYVNRGYKASACDWVLLVDADEFLFYLDAGEPCHDLRGVLSRSGADVHTVQFYDVYPHKDDQPLDAQLPPVPQRRHGKVGGVKPCVARGGLDLFWRVGCHELLEPSPQLNYSYEELFGAHWNMADEDFAVERILKNRRARQSKSNLERGMGTHYYDVTAKELRRRFEENLEAPQLF